MVEGFSKSDIRATEFAAAVSANIAAIHVPSLIFKTGHSFTSFARPGNGRF